MTETFAQRLLGWYDSCRRVFAFRGPKDPYRVWLSEIMLQQTRTESVVPYYERFLARFPTVQALAEAGEEDVLRAWQGLGYYTRARNLHNAARKIVNELGGAFPSTAEALRALPGVGPYTAAAIASIAFDEPVPAMDGNLIRVFARRTDEAEDASKPAALRRLTEEARRQMPADRPGDYNQALMDLGATICVPGTPDCDACPVREGCRAAALGHPEARPVLPRKAPPKAVPLNVVLIFCGDRVYMKLRQEALLKGMYVFALTEGAPKDALTALCLSPVPCEHVGDARHVFTHRVWEMALWTARVPEIPPALDHDFYTLTQLDGLPMPVAMRAALEIARKELTHEAKA